MDLIIDLGWLERQIVDGKDRAVSGVCSMGFGTLGCADQISQEREPMVIHKRGALTLTSRVAVVHVASHGQPKDKVCVQSATRTSVTRQMHKS